MHIKPYFIAENRQMINGQISLILVFKFGSKVKADKEAI